MRKENYKNSNTLSSDSYSVKSSPSISGNKSSKGLAGSIIKKSSLKKSLSNNIDSLNKVLKESEKILPKTNSR